MTILFKHFAKLYAAKLCHETGLCYLYVTASNGTGSPWLQGPRTSELHIPGLDFFLNG